MKVTKEITQLLTRGVDQVIPKNDLAERLMEGRPLRIKNGIDPTGPRLHLGHGMVLWKLREFQKLGHQIVLIVGDFTGMIGDASDKQAMRQPLTREQIEENMKDYRDQFAQILDMKKVEIRYNSEWLKTLDFSQLLGLTQLFTVAQLIERENFYERFSSKKPIGLQEFLYPIMQGYDSFAIQADVEIGGKDQLFNMMAGRKIQEKLGLRPQSVLTLQTLETSDGKKMSKSWPNCVFIADSPTEQFGKIMATSDDFIIPYFRLATDVDEKEIVALEEDLRTGEHPKAIKMRLAWEIVRRYHSDKQADAAQAEFENVFSKGGAPEDAEIIFVSEKKILLTDLLMQTKLVSSRGDAKRLISQRAVHVDDAIVDDASAPIDVTKKRLVKIGKRRFAYVVKK